MSRGETIGRCTTDAHALLPYVRDLMAKNYEAVGFIPVPRIEKYAERGQILIGEENGDPCGYLVFGNGFPVLKVYQCCIQYDARRLDHATTLVLRLEAIASDRGCSAISLWCADDLEANSFWRASGFDWHGLREGGARRGRKHNLWVKRLPHSHQSSLFPDHLRASSSEAA